SWKKVVALRPNPSWTKGEAWILEIREGAEKAPPLTAWRATYSFHSDKLDEDILLLKIGPTRQYDAKVNHGRVEWSYTTERMQGVVFELLLDGGAVPNDAMTAIPTRFFYVDENGHETNKYYTEERF